GHPLPLGRCVFGRGIEHDPGHGTTSRVTDWLPVSPLIQPPMMAENIPAVPPAWTNHRPSGRNLGQSAPVRASGRPSAQSPAPRQATLDRQRLPGRAVLVLGETERVLAGVAERGPVDLAGATAADVADHELESASDGGVGPISLAQDVDARVHPDGPRHGAVY